MEKPAFKLVLPQLKIQLVVGAVLGIIILSILGLFVINSIKGTKTPNYLVSGYVKLYKLSKGKPLLNPASAGSPATPVKTTVTFKSVKDSSKVFTANSDQTGQYNIQLPADTYQIIVGYTVNQDIQIRYSGNVLTKDNIPLIDVTGKESSFQVNVDIYDFSTQ